MRVQRYLRSMLVESHQATTAEQIGWSYSCPVPTNVLYAPPMFILVYIALRHHQQSIGSECAKRPR